MYLSAFRGRWLVSVGAGGAFVASMLACVASAETDCPNRSDGSPGSQPGIGTVLGLGAAMAAAYFPLGVAVHEGSHALATVSFGGKVTSFEVIPQKTEKGLRFGEMSREGNFTSAQEFVISSAPKITDLMLMGGYAAIVATDNLPRSKYAQLPLLVVASSAWIDFAKDTFTRNPYNDQMKAWRLVGADTEGERLPFRLVQGALSAAGAVPIALGFIELFKAPAPARDRSIASERKPATGKIHPVLSPTSVGVGGTF